VIDFKARLKEQQDDVLYLCVDKDKAIICLESLISVIKGEEKESDNSYMGMLLITDTICKMNIFLTGWVTPSDKKEEKHISEKEHLESLEKQTGKNIDKEELKGKWEEFMKKGKDILKPQEKKTRFSK